MQRIKTDGLRSGLKYAVPNLSDRPGGDRTIAAQHIHALLPSEPGTYALILHCHTAGEQPVGALGQVRTEVGFYIYVGSALGPGGIRGRVARHLREAKKPHWHIDYLRRTMPVTAIWYAETASVQEHHWALTIDNWSQAEKLVPGFGASDCQCESHLFFCSVPPSLPDVRERLETTEDQTAVVVKSVAMDR